MLRMPDASAIMALADSGAVSPTRRDDALLARFDSGLSADDAVALTVQARESRLLDILENCFGSELEASAACPVCGAALDVPLRTGSLRQPPIGDGDAGFPRSPTGADLRAIEDCHDLEQARALLLARCGINPAEETAAIAALAMENAQADVHLALRCAVCGHQWEAQFEAGVFVWKRVERLAADLIRQVHALARAYHWTEEAILAMPERRRARYLSTLAAEQNG